jgi:hypothetical protein
VLTAEEKLRWGEHSICAGILGFPINKTGLEFIKDWHKANLAKLFRGNDQGNLIGLLLRKYLGKWEYLGNTVFGRRLERYDETLIHFSAKHDQLLLEYYRLTLGLTEPQDE